MIQANEQDKYHYVTLSKVVADFLRPKGNWKPVTDSKGLYEVSDEGFVWSVRRKKLLSQSNARYRQVSATIDGEQLTLMVHRLVAYEFVPNPYGKRFVNHKDGNRYNNRADNLEWCTPSENYQHAIGMGLAKLPANPAGELHPASKLNSVDIQMILALSQHDFTNVQIAQRFGVSAAHIGLIINRNRSKY